MRKVTTGIMFAMALLFIISAPRLPKSEAARQACAANAKAANFDFTLKDLSGKNVSLGAYKGSVVLLDFWATWCPPCRKEIPGFVELYNKYRSRGFIVLGVSMDDEIADVKKFAQELKMNYPILIGYGRDDIEKAYGPMPGLPTSFIIARDGRICSQHTGFVEKDQFEARIKALL